MKRTYTLKTILVCASLLSLSAFAFVNLSTNNTSLTQPFPTFSSTQNKVEEEAVEESRELPVPNVTVLGRVYGIARKILDKTN